MDIFSVSKHYKMKKDFLVAAIVFHIFNKKNDKMLVNTEVTPTPQLHNPTSTKLHNPQTPQLHNFPKSETIHVRTEI
jgi:hypothetical protein